MTDHPSIFDDAIGRIETQDDIIDATRLAQAAAMLGLGDEGQKAALAEGATLPPMFHLFYGNNTSDRGRLDHDGHEALGRFIPDVTKAKTGGGNFHRRMWAAGDVRFEGALKTGQRLKRQSTIRKIEEKTGKTGPLIFVTVDRALETATGRVDEVRTIVYRETATTPAPDSIPLTGADGMTVCHDWLPDPVQLFRFSALTWNGHRIHFDLDHCRRVEFYPDLITHGPFTAMMLANLTPQGMGFIAAMRGEGRGDGRGEGRGEGRYAGGDAGAGIARLKRFQFRGTQALYANRQVSLCLDDDGTKAEARNHHGQQAMTAIREW